MQTLDTPAVLVDLDVAERNIDRFQAYCDRLGLKARPHAKTHKLPVLARRQVAAGAVGITCQKLSEAEALIEAGGIDDVLITYNILGSTKLDRLRRLRAVARIAVVADNATVVEGLAAAFGADEPLSVLVECDTGGGRCGVQTPDDARGLAGLIAAAPGLDFAGLMTYPAAGATREVQAWLSEAKRACEDAGLPVRTVSGGGSPGMWQAGDVPVLSEYRAGTYVYNDRSLVARGVCTLDDCALSVLATVISTPAPGRAVIDAGSKVLTTDLFGLEGHGHVLGHPAVAVASLSEEHAVLTGEALLPFTVGNKVRIVPNHACVVSNMVDEVVALRGGKVEGPIRVAARGCVR